MSTFDQVIGYDAIKEELLQICDMIHDPEAYGKLGARLPHGVLLEGDPGLGKTLMAKCFIAESGLKTYTVRRTRADDDFIGGITDTFLEAKENCPAIVFLDDLDKFANEDDEHCDAKEYVAVQAGIDEVKDSDVFVIATVNDRFKLPDSLIRSGRFDRHIKVRKPNAADAERIIKHYLSAKPVSDDVSLEDISKMISYSSCAELETILNEAAVNAAYRRKPSVEMSDLIGAVLRMQYNAPGNYSGLSDENRKRIALHEAGHVTVCEALAPGSVGFATVRSSGGGDMGGFVHRCAPVPKQLCHALVSLAGKAAAELYYADGCTSGCDSDIETAYNVIRDGMAELATHGFAMVDVTTGRFPRTSESMNARNESVVQAELEKCMVRSREILLNNRAFLERVATELAEKDTLLYSDIRRIREMVPLVPANI